MSTSLKREHHSLSEPAEQIKIIEEKSSRISFDEKLIQSGLHPLTSTGIQVFQINIGKMCNQVCKHCHVDAGPDRTEIMTLKTMETCLQALSQTDIPTVDITGGAPELNPHFKWLVTEMKKLNRYIMVRSNLTILVSPGFEEYPEFFKEQGLEVVSSLPYYLAENTDAQRGKGVFEKSILALKRLNELGYGQAQSHLLLNLVYNPVGAFLPPSQSEIESDYRRELSQRYGIVFNHLYTITNMPISRFLVYLIKSGNYAKYMDKLYHSYNPQAAQNVMCRTTLSIGWDGYLYDCDFNQMLNIRVDHGAPSHIRDFDYKKLSERRVLTGQHCYGCTAGTGSSCGGAIA